MKKIKIIFLSSSDFGVPAFKKLALDKRFEILALITLPDKPKDRGLKTESSLLKKIALGFKIKVLEVYNFRDKNLNEEVKLLLPDAIIMTSFGKIIPLNFLKISKHGVLNIHPSLLPKFRGSSPIQSVILNGEKETGVTIMFTTEKMDEGPILKISNLRFQISKIGYKELHDKLANLGSEMICDVIPEWVFGKIKAIPQNESNATYTKKITKENGLINWNEPAEIIERKIRAFEFWPTCYFFFKKNDKIKLRVQILEAEVLSQNEQICDKYNRIKINTGEFFEINHDLAVQTGQGILKLIKVKPEGKKDMKGHDFLQGYKKFII